MKEDKNFSKKIYKTLEVIALIATISGLSIYGIIGMFKDSKENEPSTTPLVQTNTNATDTEEPTEEPTLTLSENHTPNDAATNVYISEWDSSSDIGIDGNLYEGGHKITISNTFNALGSSLENKVKSRIIIPLSEEFKQKDKTHRFIGTFVLEKNMFGSESSGTIKILINNKKVFSTGKIGGNTTKAFPFDINYRNADSIIIQTNVSLKGSDFVYGFVNSRD